MSFLRDLRGVAMAWCGYLASTRRHAIDARYVVETRSRIDFGTGSVPVEDIHEPLRHGDDAVAAAARGEGVRFLGRHDVRGRRGHLGRGGGLCHGIANATRHADGRAAHHLGDAPAAARHDVIPGERPRRPARDGRRVEPRRGQAGPSPEKTGEARHDAAERGPLPDGRQRRGDAAFELFHLFGREDDARLLMWSFDELRGWLELERGCSGCNCCAQEELHAFFSAGRVSCVGRDSFRPFVVLRACTRSS